MSSVKISGLPASSNLNANPAHSLFPTTDTDTNQTTKIDAKSLGNTLYANNVLVVGTGGTSLPNLVAQYTGISGGYTQVNEQNLNANGTADYIVTADTGSDTYSYIDLGFTNSSYNVASPYNSLGTAIEPLSGYLYVQGNANANSGNLVIGTVNANTELRLLVGGITATNIVSKVTSSTYKIYRPLEVTGNVTIKNSGSIVFTDDSSLNTAPATLAYSQAAFNTANGSLQNTSTITVNNSIVIPGNLSLGSNSIIYGDWSNSNVAQRTAFTTSTPNGNTGVYIVPNGTSVSASLQITNASDPTNASKILLSANGTSNVQISSTRNGTGTYLPMDFRTNGVNQMTLDTGGSLNIYNGNLNVTNNVSANYVLTTNAVISGNLTINGTEIRNGNTVVNGNTTWNGSVTANGSFTANVISANVINSANVTINTGVVVNDAGLFQYSTTNNAIVTQTSNKGTSVTANGRTGQITTSNASLAKGVAITFTVNNNQIVSANDMPFVAIASGATTNSYAVCVTRIVPGAFDITITNNGSGALTDTLVINFAIIRVQ